MAKLSHLYSGLVLDVVAVVLFGVAFAGFIPAYTIPAFGSSLVLAFIGNWLGGYGWARRSSAN